MVDMTDMAPGREARAWLAFKVGAGCTPAELHYRSFTGTPRAIKLR
jgi:hypothetical protein